MNLYIRLMDGKPFEHPIFEDNLIEAFPEIDLNNLPPNLARFNRIQVHECGIEHPTDHTKKLAVVDYVLHDDGETWKDQWDIVDRKPHEIEHALRYHPHMSVKQSFAGLANNIKATLTDPDEIEVFDSYLNLLDAVEILPNDFSTLFPLPPIKNADGKYFARLDENKNWKYKSVVLG
jgi:hypothetical protein